MSEQQPDPQTRPSDPDGGSHASVGDDVDRPGGGRTVGETSVDEAMGAEDDAAR